MTGHNNKALVFDERFKVRREAGEGDENASLSYIVAP